ncbi:MAG: hypothetical protein ACREV5_18800 [Steroidobacter sp.]
MTRINSLLLVVLSVAGISACDVDQTREAEAPDVNVEGGQAPAYDVDGPDVDVSREERTVTVPDVDVDVQKEEKTVTTPDVDVQPPPED